MGVVNEWKRNLGEAWETVADGWRDLRARAAEAVTRFRPSRGSDTADADVELPANWALLAADLYDDDDKVVVRLEAPGMSRNDFTVEVRDGHLVVAGEKRFERESTNGRYRTMQCAYGRFERVVQLPTKVQGDRAQARYRDGVLRIELPKAESHRARRIAVRGP